jgi:hypothetical protein
MLTRSIRRVLSVAVVASATLLGTTVERAAADTMPFDAGIACEFPLTVDSGEDTRSVHTFTDASGDVVRLLLAGRGTAVTLTNEDTGATLSLPANGAPWSIVNHPDGTSTYTTMGHLVLILFPTDVPAGPSTTLYVGRVVFDVNNTTGVFTLKETRGTATDLCAALSG